MYIYFPLKNLIKSGFNIHEVILLFIEHLNCSLNKMLYVSRYKYNINRVNQTRLGMNGNRIIRSHTDRDRVYGKTFIVTRTKLKFETTQSVLVLVDHG